MKTTRSYTMTVRAAAVEATRTSVLEAVEQLAGERPLGDVALDDIAGRAGVSVQTVLRQFGSKAQLFETAATRIRQSVAEERRTPVGDVTEAVRVLVDHYERRGSMVLLLLAQEGQEDFVTGVTAAGRALHRSWVEEVLAPYLPRADGREEVVDLLGVATDVYVWKLLRRDRGLSRARTQQRMELLVRTVLAGLGESTEES